MQKLLCPIRTNGPGTQERLPVGILPHRLVYPINEEEDHVELREISLAECLIFLVESPAQVADRRATQKRLPILIDKRLFNIAGR